MDRSVAHLNIQRYRQMLEQESDDGKRALLERLIAEEQARLQQSQSGGTPPKSDG